MTAEMMEAHLTAMEVAAYVDNGLDLAACARVRVHLAECDECRGEVTAVARLAPSRTGAGRRWKVLVPLAAAAILILYLAPRPNSPDWTSPPVLREPAVTTIVAPIPIAPRGHVATLPSLSWSSVPLAGRYQVTLFDPEGTVLWETLTADTTAAVPPTVHVAAGVPHYWKVAARTEVGRWVASELTSFTLRPARP